MTSAKPAIMNASNAGRNAPARTSTKRKRSPATAAAPERSKKAGESSGEPPAAAPAPAPAPARSGNAGKTRYRSLRMNAGIHCVVLYQIFSFCLTLTYSCFY